MKKGCPICEAPRNRWEPYCPEHMRWHFAQKLNWEVNCGRRQAGGIVTAAKRMGLLPHLDGSIACVDCGAPACDYDHRDYNKPLEVEPVCRRCNKLRGSAIPLATYRPLPKPAGAAA